MTRLPYVVAFLALALAGTAGFLASSAIGQGEPTSTVTIDVATGAQGPRGEQGPPGPPGPKGDPGPSGLACIAGYSPGVLVVNHAGGRTTVYTCLKD